MEALDCGDARHEESMAFAGESFDDNDDADTDTMDNMQGLYQHATTPLYDSATSSI